MGLGLIKYRQDLTKLKLAHCLSEKKIKRTWYLKFFKLVVENVPIFKQHPLKRYKRRKIAIVWVQAQISWQNKSMGEKVNIKIFNGK